MVILATDILGVSLRRQGRARWAATFLGALDQRFPAIELFEPLLRWQKR